MESRTIELLEKISGQLEQIIAHQSKIPVVYSVNLGTMMDVAGAPAELFKEDFARARQAEIVSMLSDVAIKAAKQHSQDLMKKAFDSTKTGDYKKSGQIVEMPNTFIGTEHID